MKDLSVWRMFATKEQIEAEDEHQRQTTQMLKDIIPRLETRDDFRKMYMCEFPPPSEISMAGYEAARAGKERSCCPYDRHDERREEWLSGWKQFQKTGK